MAWRNQSHCSVVFSSVNLLPCENDLWTSFLSTPLHSRTICQNSNLFTIKYTDADISFTLVCDLKIVCSSLTNLCRSLVAKAIIKVKADIYSWIPLWILNPLGISLFLLFTMNVKQHQYEVWTEPYDCEWVSSLAGCKLLLE